MALELELTDQKYWQISPYLAEYLAVEEGELVWLHVGASRCQVIVKIHANYICMSLNRPWAEDLHLAPGKWKIRRVRDGIRLGPIIGIVCGKLPSHPPAESSWPRYLSAIDGGLGVLVTPEGFDQERRCVHGLTLSEDKLYWVEGELPWPDALYVRTYPVNPSIKAFLQKEFPYHHFNTQTLFNKWSVFQSLSERQAIKPYLPETAILENDPAAFKSWVDRFPAVYVKPIFGDIGHGEMRITAENGNYRVTYKKNLNSAEAIVPISVPIRQELIDIMGESQFIMQQAISLPENDDRTIGFRILMQKKDDGLWYLTGLWGKRGAPGSGVNNLATGDEHIPLARILENGTIPKAQRMKEIYRLCLLVALTLEEYFGQLGEIGLDLCIDCVDHLWLLEVNGMPSKNFLTKFCSPKVTNSIYTAPMLYAAYLSGFSDVIYPLA